MAGSLLNLCMTLLVAVTMLAASGTAPAQAAQCLDNRMVQGLIAAHKIRTWPAIKALAGVSDAYKESLGGEGVPAGWPALLRRQRGGPFRGIQATGAQRR